jgi:hypothetical protein
MFFCYCHHELLNCSKHFFVFQNEYQKTNICDNYQDNVNFNVYQNSCRLS